MMVDLLYDKAANLPYVLAEWEKILLQSSNDEIFEILEGSSQKAKRLRSSSPFTGILTENERNVIFQMYSNKMGTQ